MHTPKIDVKKIAGLARIKLTHEEEQKFEGELSKILGFVEELNEVDTSRVLPVTGGAELQNETRKDDRHNTDLEGTQDALLSQVPQQKGAWVKVKTVFQ